MHLTTKHVKQIRRLSKQRISAERIALALDISPSTVRKYRSDKCIERANKREQERYLRISPAQLELRRERARAVAKAKKQALLDSSEPFFVRERTVPYLKLAMRWFENKANVSRKMGAVFYRASCHPDDHKRLLFEAWGNRPDDQGPLRWKDTI